MGSSDIVIVVWVVLLSFVYLYLFMYILPILLTRNTKKKRVLLNGEKAVPTIFMNSGSTLPPHESLVPGHHGRFLMVDGEPMDKKKQMAFLQQLMGQLISKLAGSKRTLSSPDSMLWLDKEFYLYDVRWIHDPTLPGFRITVLLDPPPIHLSDADPVYVQWYPLLNPYLHMVEIHYLWKEMVSPKDQGGGYTMGSQLLFDSARIVAVPWTVNRYHQDYLQRKTSPICTKNMPEPRPITDDKMESLLQQTGLLTSLTPSSLYHYTSIDREKK